MHKSCGKQPRVDECSEKDALLVLYVISIAQVTSKGGHLQTIRYCDPRSLSQFVGHEVWSVPCCE